MKRMNTMSIRVSLKFAILNTIESFEVKRHMPVIDKDVRVKSCSTPKSSLVTLKCESHGKVIQAKLRPVLTIYLREDQI